MTSSGQFGKPLILSIDDSENQLRVRRAVLEQGGFSVLNAATPEQAVNLLREEPVCLILSDHMLSGTTGTQLAVEFKRVKPSVPVVLYSGAPPPTLQNVDCFINKSEPVGCFLAIIRDLVKRFSMQHPALLAAASTAASQGVQVLIVHTSAELPKAKGNSLEIESALIREFEQSQCG